MKLVELKNALVDQFFTASSGGVSALELPAVYAALGERLKADLSAISDNIISEEQSEGISSDPSKGFKKFTDGRRSLLAIMEDGKAIFAAARVGRVVSYVNLTLENRVEKIGDLLTVKTALKQAKNINDDVHFSIATKG